MRVLFQFETSWAKIFEEMFSSDSNSTASIPQPLPELKACLLAFEDVVKVTQTGPSYFHDSFEL